MAGQSKPHIQEANEMLSKTRTSIIALVASASFGGAALVPTVAQAKPKRKVNQVTCPDITGAGVGQPGEERTIEWNEIGSDGSFHIAREKKICGLDGKWHKVVDRVLTGGTLTEAPKSAPEPGSPPPTRPAPPLSAGTLG
jgi:hypothetical protein